LIGIGSIIVSPSQSGSLDTVTAIHKVAEGLNGTLSRIHFRHRETDRGTLTERHDRTDPTTTVNAARRGDGPAVVLDIRVNAPARPEAGARSPVSATAGEDTPSDARLTPEERRIVDQLRIRDGAVRQEEQTHAATAGRYASAPQYEYVTGPDGRQYAISGHVDVRAVNLSGDPEEARRAANILQNAAVAPNAPSAQDLIAARGFDRLGGAAAQVSRDNLSIRNPALDAYSKVLEPDSRPPQLDITG